MKGTGSELCESRYFPDIFFQARFTRPLALLGGGFSTDLSTYTADLDLLVRKGSYKKRIIKERVPLDQLGSLLGQTAKTKAYEKE